MLQSQWSGATYFFCSRQTSPDTELLLYKRMTVVKLNVTKEEPRLKVIFFGMSGRKNQSVYKYKNNNAILLIQYVSWYNFRLENCKKYFTLIASNSIWGHSTTRWTKSYPILTTHPSSSGHLCTFYIIPAICLRDQEWTFYWPPTTSSCPRSYWMTPTYPLS